MSDPATYDLSTPLRQVLTIPLNQRGSLKRAGYTTLGELVGLSVSQLKRIKGIGDTTAKQIREIVAEAKYATAESDYAQLDGSEPTEEDAALDAAAAQAGNQTSLRELEEMREKALGETSRLTAPLIGEDAAADAMIEEEEQDVAAAAETFAENRPTERELAGVRQKLSLPVPQPPAPFSDDDPAVIAAVDHLTNLPPAPRQQRHEIPWDADTIRKILVLDRRWPAPGLEKKARMVLVFLQQGEELDDAAEKAGFAPSEDSVAAVVGTVRALFERVALMCVNRALPR